MSKFWTVVRGIVFLWGALTLALILFGLLSSVVAPLFHGGKHQQATSPTEETVLEKKEGNYKLLVKQKETEGPSEYFLTLSRDDQRVVQNYRLPTQKYKLDNIDIYDATLLPGRDNECRVVLYTAFSDEESESESYIWFLKSAGTMTVQEVTTLSDVHQSPSDGLMILGSKRFRMPYQKSFHSEWFVVPVMVRVGDSISVSPLLSPMGADALRRAFEQEIKARMEVPSDGKEEKRGEQYQKVRKEMSEALSERVISY